MSRSKAAKLLIDMGAPAGVYDIKGEVALSLLILKMPDVALVALDQFHSEDMINRKEYYFLNYLEGPRLLEDKVYLKYFNMMLRCFSKTPPDY